MVGPSAVVGPGMTGGSGAPAAGFAVGSRLRTAAALVAGLLLAPGCAADPVPPAAERWYLGEALLEMGPSEVDPDYTFHRVSSIQRSPGGDLIVAERGQMAVRIYSGDGRLVRSFGRRGGGPDEFGYIASVAPYVGDSLVVFDPMYPRVSIWSAQGDFGRSFALDAVEPVIRQVLALSTGEFVAVRSSTTLVREAGGSVLDSADFVLLGRSGNGVRTLIRLPHNMWYGNAGADGRVTTTRLPLHPRSYVTAEGDALLYGWADRWVVQRVGSGSIDSLPIARQVRPVTPAAIAAHLHAHLARSSPRDASAEAQLRSMWARARLPWPETLPAFDRMLVDDVGVIWLREFTTLDQQTTTWLAVDERGRIMAELEASPALEPLHIGRDFIAGVMTDDFERERIVVLRLQRGATEPAPSH
jgi:hypothetical protein